jgi:hypothetical protein
LVPLLKKIDGGMISPVGKLATPNFGLESRAYHCCSKVAEIAALIKISVRFYRKTRTTA